MESVIYFINPMLPLCQRPIRVEKRGKNQFFREEVRTNPVVHLPGHEGGAVGDNWQVA
jgi:hypothetical protein